jgi:hypothetical protein
MHALLHSGGVAADLGTSDPCILLACYLAAVSHDVGHTGATNDHLVATLGALALRYNDMSPHENYHAAAAFCTLSAPSHDFLSHLPKVGRWVSGWVRWGAVQCGLPFAGGVGGGVNQR